MSTSPSAPSQHPFLISLQTYRQQFEALKADKKDLENMLEALELTDAARIKAQLDLESVIEPKIKKLQSLFDGNFAFFQRRKINNLATNATNLTDIHLDAVKKRTDEIAKQREQAERQAALDQQRLEELRSNISDLNSDLRGTHQRSFSASTRAETISTFKAASVSSENHFSPSSESAPIMPFSLEQIPSSHFTNYDNDVHSSGPLAPAKAPYIPQPIADLSRFNDPNYRPSLSSDDAHPNIVEDEYSATMFIAHHRTFSGSSAPPKRLDTPEPALPSLPVPPRRKPSLSPAFNFATDSHPLATTKALSLRAERSIEPAFVRASSHDAQNPREGSIGNNVDSVYERPDTGGSDTLSYVYSAEVSSDGHGTHSSNLSIHTDAFGTHH